MGDDVNRIACDFNARVVERGLIAIGVVVSHRFLKMRILLRILEFIIRSQCAVVLLTVLRAREGGDVLAFQHAFAGQMLKSRARAKTVQIRLRTQSRILRGHSRIRNENQGTALGSGNLGLGREGARRPIT